MIRRLLANLQPKPLGRHNARRTDPVTIDQVAEILAPPAALTLERRLELGCDVCSSGVAFSDHCPKCGRGSYAHA